MSRQKARILVVEDSRADRMLLTALLRRQGYSVIEAADGPAAIAQFEAARPDLVLLDVIMPGMDGIEVARVIGDAARRRFVPIIFLTALQEPAALARCLDAGGVDFLTKPYHDIILKAKLGVFLRMAEMQRQLQRQRDEIARHNERLLQEQEVAKVVYDKVAHHGDLDLPH
ncbi:MAG: response regulator, partial [Spongiibacteraceae bacterium]|nr:response regulator [Spongiibacteraceae bacterium]